MKSDIKLTPLCPFLLLWSTQTLSELGTAMTNYALVIWLYQQNGSASSVSTLTLCSFLPTILFRFAGGTLADRWNKKQIMLLCDLFAAIGSLTILMLHSLSSLRIWHLYLIHALLSCMNAVQVPASFTATSLLVPKEHYTRISGLQSFSGAAVSILAPALGGGILAYGGLNTVLLCDLITFSLSLAVLLLFIRIPETANKSQEHRRNSFWSDCADGLHYLQSHRDILHITLFLAAVNLLVKLGNDGMLAPFVLSRTGSDEQALGLVQSFVSIGLLIGSVLTTISKPVKDKSRLAYGACLMIFAAGLVQSLSSRIIVWCATAFVVYLSAAIMNANMISHMRQQVPVTLHGRVFSAKDTLQNCTIPLGLFLGGLLADHVFEPLMASNFPLQQMLTHLFGAGKGAGIALQFFLVSLIGVLMCIPPFVYTICKGRKTR